MRHLRFVLGIGLVATVIYLSGGAWDQVHAQSPAPSPSKLKQAPSLYYQGLSAREWAERAVTNRKRIIWHRRNSSVRADTIARLKRQLERHFFPSHWIAVGSCESGLRWDYNGSSGFDGAVQFHPGTWSANRLPGYPSHAYEATPFQQLVIAELVLARAGWGQWPACSRKLGLR